MNGFFIFDEAGARERFLEHPEVRKISDRVELSRSSTQPVIVFRAREDESIDRLRELAEEMGGRLQPSRRYEPV